MATQHSRFPERTSRATRQALTPTVLTLSATGLVTVLLAACGTTTAPPQADPDAPACIENYDADTDYFPHKATFEHATGVTVTYHNSYKTVVVKEPQPGAKAATYVLVQCGAPTPQLTGALAGATAVTIPVKRVASASTTHVPVFEMLDKVDALAGMATPNMLWEGAAHDAFKAGKIQAYGNDSGGIDIEKVAAIKPDVYITGGMDEAEGKKVATLGIPVVANSEWLEKSPLGRSEWIKYLALYVNAEEPATEEFDKIVSNYQGVAEKAKDVTNRPTVLLGGGFKGTWYRAAGGSYVAALMKDAGANYIYANVPGNGSDPVDIEQILATGANAQFWLNGHTAKGWNTIADAIKDDARYGRFAAVKSGNVWNPTKRIGPAGGNDYWQSGVVRPDAVLKDLVAIFHPELEPDHDFTYYEKLAP